MLILLFLLLLASPVSAASLIWDPTADGFLLLQYSATESGPFTVLKEIPAYPPSFPITEFGYYKLTVPNGGPSSNVARYSADIETGLTDQVTALEARVTALETVPVPATTSNFKVTVLDADHLEIVGLNCPLGLSTSGTGTKRIITCKR
jgi:hypothetical protein